MPGLHFVVQQRSSSDNNVLFAAIWRRLQATHFRLFQQAQLETSEFRTLLGFFVG